MEANDATSREASFHETKTVNPPHSHNPFLHSFCLYGVYVWPWHKTYCIYKYVPLMYEDTGSGLGPQSYGPRGVIREWGISTSVQQMLVAVNASEASADMPATVELFPDQLKPHVGLWLSTCLDRPTHLQQSHLHCNCTYSVRSIHLHLEYNCGWGGGRGQWKVSSITFIWTM